MSSAGPRRRYWRLYRSSLDRRVIRDELLALPREAYAEVKAAMDDVEDFGLQESKRLRNEIREIVAGDPTQGTAYRLLFAVDGRQGQILLGLVLFNKKTQKTLPRYIDLGEKRLADWRSRRQRSEI
jgi:phage-related protein